MKTFIILFCLFMFRNRFKLLLELIYWVSIDIYRKIKNKPPLHMYGIRLICGLYGQGKTMALTQYLSNVKIKYGDKVLIATNYGFVGEDFPLTSWEQMLIEYDRPIIFGYDEIQNEFNSRDYKNFPPELLTLLTQNRKGNGKQIIGTAQRYCRVDKVFRELCSHVAECKTTFGRYTRVRWYDWGDYEMLLHTVDVRQKFKIKASSTIRFVQTDKLRSSYDSFKMLKSAKNKNYLTLEERALKAQLNM